MNIDCSQILTAAEIVFNWYRNEQFSGCIYYIWRACLVHLSILSNIPSRCELHGAFGTTWTGNIFRICFFKHQKGRVSPSRTPWQYFPLKESIAISCFVSLLSYFLVLIKNIIFSDTLQKSPAKNIGAFYDRYPAAYCNMMGLLYCFFKMGYWRI